MAKNMFASAETVQVKSPAAEKESKNKVREVNIGDSLDYLAAINALTKSLESIQSVYYGEVVDKMSEDFVNESVSLKKRPANFRGIGSNSEASCEMRKRSSRSYLSDEEVAVLQQNNIKYDQEVISEEIPERFFFNPEILTDASLAEKISEKLSEIPELQDKTVIMKQAKRDKVVKNVVSEDSFDQIAQLSDKSLVKKLLAIVSTYGVKAKLNIQDIDKVLEIVRKSGLKI